MTRSTASTTATTTRLRIGVAVVLLLALAFGAWGVWRVWVPAPDDMRAQLADSQRTVHQQQSQIEHLRQQVATLSRSDQISRDANRDLQGTLAERDEEIAALRADVAFYERLVGATAQRHSLTVHALDMQAQAAQPDRGSSWHFTSTLTQNLDRGAVSSGRLTLSIEGTRDGQLQTLDWAQLRQQSADEAEGLAYSFKYFQGVEGDVFLPPDFTPSRVTVTLQPESGDAVERSFTWAEALSGKAPAG